jgi:hypothetical protein
MKRNKKPLRFLLTVDYFRWSARNQEYRKGVKSGLFMVLPNLHQFRRLIVPYQAKKYLIIVLQRELPAGIDPRQLHKVPLEDGAAIEVSVARDKAVVRYWSQLAGEFAPSELASHEKYEGPDKPLPFPAYFVPGGEWRVHPYWTVTRADGFQALEYFLRYGKRDPAFSWVEVDDPESIEQA